MMPQRNASESRNEQASSTYGKYEGDVLQCSEIPYEQPLRDGPREKIYLPPKGNTNMFRLLTFVIAMVTLLVFVVVCLVFVGGTGGWISFCAASFAILVTASTFIGMKPEGRK